MALVNITNIVFENEFSLFQTPISMQITFETYNELRDELDWTLIYVGSPQSEKYDQILDNFSMGPLQKGVMQFTITSQPPKYELIPTKEDLFGVSALILTAKYRQQEFFRVGYYIYNNYNEPELIENEPQYVLIDKVYRQIMVQNPRITKFPIDWEGQLIQLYCPPNNQEFMFSGLNNIIQQNNVQQMQTEQQQLQNQQQNTNYNTYMNNIF